MSDPFGDPRFVSNHMRWIETLNADAFRAKIQALGLLTSIQEIADLKLKQTNGENPAHNSHVISLINPGGNLAYKLLCQAIYSMNPILHTAKFNEMILLLPENQRPSIDSFPTAAPVTAPPVVTNVPAAAAASDNWPQGSKRLKDIDNHTTFAQSLQPFFDKKEKRDLGRKAVEAVDPDLKNDSYVVLEQFHDDHEGRLDGGKVKGQDNLMCIIYYLIVKNGEMTIHALFEMLRACAPENTDAIKKELMAASYN
eukprot:scpid102311/ scgid31478/ 